MVAPGNANSINGLITNIAAGAIANTSVVTTNQNLADQDCLVAKIGR